MIDTRSPQTRRLIMQSVGTKHTGPEMVVRRLLRLLGRRYRLHRSDLPGRPDIVICGERKAIFVHGCFWHAHDCAKGRAPKSNLDYWVPKREANRARDERHFAELVAQGWNVLTVWQCETKQEQNLLAKLAGFLENQGSSATGG